MTLGNEKIDQPNPIGGLDGREWESKSESSIQGEKKVVETWLKSANSPNGGQQQCRYTHAVGVSDFTQVNQISK